MHHGFAGLLSYPRDMLMGMASGSDRKGRGAFYTPPEIVVPMIRWAIRDRCDAVLDGGAGESAFLVAAARRLLGMGLARSRVLDQVHGVELDGVAAELSAKSLAAVVDGDPADARIIHGSFFDLVPYTSLPSVAACIGNPPYIRYQSFTGEARKQALARAAEGGVKLSGLTSSWAPFLVHACQFVSPGGRLAQVMPAELLHTSYAQPIRDYLVHRFHSVVLVTFDARVFPGALEEVVLLLAADEGPKGLQVRETHGIKDLDHVIENGSSRSRSIPRPRGKWSKYLLLHDELRSYERLSRDSRVTTLADYGTTDIGVVTGANSFFVLDEQNAQKAELPTEDLVPTVAKAEHIQGLRLRRKDFARLKSNSEPCLMFNPSKDELSPASARYVRSGERIGVHNRYKCRTRNPWWKVPGVRAADIFITYMASDVPRIVINEVGAISTNTVHRFYVKGPRKTRMLLPILAVNSLTLLSAEIEGRSYGGGVLKLEPKECDRLLIPRIEDLSAGAIDALFSLLAEGDVDIREGRLGEVVGKVDDIVLRQELGISSDAINRLRDGRRRLFGRRVARMRSKPK